jgi:hypothetical protein
MSFPSQLLRPGKTFGKHTSGVAALSVRLDEMSKGIDTVILAFGFSRLGGSKNFLKNK